MSSRPYRLGKRADTMQETHRRILDAARHLITEAGFHPVSVGEVATRAGVGRASVYRHFGSKRELLEAVAWDVVGGAALERLDAARQLPDVAEALHEFLRENCRFFSEIGEGLRSTLDAAREEPEVAYIVEVTYFGRRVESLRELAARLEEEGALREGWTREGVVEALMILTSLEAFEVLTQRRGHSPETAGAALVAMTAAFVP